MRAMDVLKAPYWVASLASGAKSFKDNPIIGSRWANEHGLHVKRITLAEKMSDWRRKRLAHLVDEDTCQQYMANGFVRHNNVLDEEALAGIRREVEENTFHAFDMRQGNAVTRFIPLPPEVLKDLPYLRTFVNGNLFQNTLRYVASTNGDPMVYLHAVITKPDPKKQDPQTHFHSDTFFPTAKCWYFLYDVPLKDGPFNYVPGSHRLTPGRLEWERVESLEAATSNNRLHARGSFRLAKEQLPELGFGEPAAFDVPGNTLVVADTHGFHARGKSEGESIRIGIYGSLRRSPFMPFLGGDPFLLPGLKGRKAQLHGDYMKFKHLKLGKPVSHRYAGKVSVRAPSKLFG